MIPYLLNNANRSIWFEVFDPGASVGEVLGASQCLIRPVGAMINDLTPRAVPTQLPRRVCVVVVVQEIQLGTVVGSQWFIFALIISKCVWIIGLFTYTKWRHSNAVNLGGWVESPSTNPVTSVGKSMHDAGVSRLTWTICNVGPTSVCIGRLLFIQSNITKVCVCSIYLYSCYD